MSACSPGQPPWRSKHAVNCCHVHRLPGDVGDARCGTLLIGAADRDLWLVDCRAAGRPDPPVVASCRSGCDLPTLSFRCSRPEATLDNSENRSNRNCQRSFTLIQRPRSNFPGTLPLAEIRTVVGGNRRGSRPRHGRLRFTQPRGPAGRARAFRAPQGPTRRRAGSAMRARTSSTAVWPILAVSWATAVSAGWSRSAAGPRRSRRLPAGQLRRDRVRAAPAVVDSMLPVTSAVAGSVPFPGPRPPAPGDLSWVYEAVDRHAAARLGREVTVALAERLDDDAVEAQPACRLHGWPSRNNRSVDRNKSTGNCPFCPPWCLVPGVRNLPNRTSAGQRTSPGFSLSAQSHGPRSHAVTVKCVLDEGFQCTDPAVASLK